MKKWISGLMIALGLCSMVESKAEANSCCYDVCDNYCAGPLSPCSFSIQLKGGVTPTHFTDRGHVWLTAPALVPPVYTAFRTSKFDKQFDTPWEAGLELAYAMSEHTQIFLEGVYQQGEGKNYNFTSGPFAINQKNGSYKTWGGYIGGRYFFDKWFCVVSPFIGFKAGFVKVKKVNAGLTLNDTFIQTAPYYHGRTGPSAGVQIGLDYNFSCNWNAVLTLEAVASQALKNNNLVTFPAAAVASGATGGLTNASIGETGYLVSFPVTLGIRYDF